MFYDDPEECLFSAYNLLLTYWKGDEVFFEGRWFEAKHNQIAHYPPEFPERENNWWKLIE